MIGPYQMVLINIFSSVLLFCGILFYKFIYPKKKINLLALLILISILPIISILRAGDYQSGDFNLHTVRSISFFNALKDGQLIPSWGDGLNETYGYPVFIFNYTFGYYIVSFLHFLGISFISGMKIFLASCFVISGIFMYLWSKRIFKNSTAAFVTAIFYLFAPYHLVDLHFRATAGETAAFAFLPILLFTIQKLFAKQNLLNILIVGMVGALSYIAHSAETTFSIILIVIPYVFFEILRLKQDKIKIFLVTCISSGLILFLSLFSWFPHILYKNYTQSSFLQISYRPTWELFYSVWRFGFLFQGPKGELSFIVGYTQWFVVFLLIILLVLKLVNKKIKPYVIFWMCLFILSFFLVTSYSKLIWQHAYLLNEAQFSTRILLQVAFCVSMLAGYLTFILKKKSFIYLLIFITISYTILNWGQRTIIPSINDSSLIQGLPASTQNYEGIASFASPRWLDSSHPWQSSKPINNIEILNGQGKINNVKRNTVSHQYIVYAISNLTVKENTLYFPGWTVKIDGKNVPIEYKNSKYLGIIIFNVPPGLHFIDIEYTDIKTFSIIKIVDIISFIVIIIFVILYLINKMYAKVFIRRSL